MGVKQIANNLQVDVQEDDWVDVDESAVTADPHWGFSFKVAEIVENASYIMIWVWNNDLQEYETTALDLSLIIDNYRKVPFV